MWYNFKIKFHACSDTRHGNQPGTLIKNWWKWWKSQSWGAIALCVQARTFVHPLPINFCGSDRHWWSTLMSACVVKCDGREFFSLLENAKKHKWRAITIICTPITRSVVEHYYFYRNVAKCFAVFFFLLASAFFAILEMRVMLQPDYIR